MLLYILAGIGILVVAALAMLKFLRNVQPDTAEVKEDLIDLKKLVEKFRNGFEKWSDEISSSDLDQILEEGQSRTGSGVFLSTTSQPIFAYAYKKYIGPGRNAVIYILNSDHEFIFRITNKGTEVTVDGEKQGLIRQNGVLYDVRNNEVAQVKRFGATAENKLFIGNKEVAKIALPNATAGIKALKIEGELLEKDAQIVQTFAVYELVSNIGRLND